MVGEAVFGLILGYPLGIQRQRMVELAFGVGAIGWQASHEGLQNKNTHRFGRREDMVNRSLRLNSTSNIPD